MHFRLNDILRFNIIVVILLILSSCRKDGSAPEILTRPLLPQEDTTYIAITEVLDKGDYKIVDHGFFYGTGRIVPGHGIGLYDEFQISLGNTIDKDTFSAIISPVISRYEYYDYEELRCFVRGYVTDERGTVYGNYVSYPILKLKALYVYPSSGIAGDSVQIVGYNFNTRPEANIVAFNNVSASVFFATQYRLYVTVPDGIIKNEFSPNVDIRVTSRGQQVEMHQIFQLD